MDIKKKLYNEIDRMPHNELILLYEQIELLKRIKKARNIPESPLTIEELHKFTSTSQASWAEDVIKNREDRI
jgi:hypothetical protein